MKAKAIRASVPALQGALYVREPVPVTWAPARLAYKGRLSVPKLSQYVVAVHGVAGFPDPVRAGDDVSRSVLRIGYRAEPQVLEVWLPPDPLVRVVAAGQHLGHHNAAQVTVRGLEVRPGAEPFGEVLQLPRVRPDRHGRSASPGDPRA